MKEESKHTELIELAIKKMTNEASQAELERLDLLLTEDSSNQSIYDEHVRTWALTEKAKGISNQEINEEWERLDRVIETSSQKENTFSVFRIAAAVTLVFASFFVGYYLLFNPASTEIVATALMEQQLEDGSNITLKANTQLSYAVDFNKATREVTLSGEAFFDVAHDKQKPFIIHAQQTDIRVLGTSFNVKADKEGSTIQVVVVTGKVKVTSSSNSVTLLPGEKGLVNKKSGKVFKIQNDDPNFQSWKTKNFVFTDLPLSDVLVLLSDVFDKPIHLKTSELGSCPVTVSFENQSLDSIIKVLTNTLDLSIQNTKRGIIVDGKGCQ